MESEVGKEFREFCILSYKYYLIGKNIEYSKCDLIEKVLTYEEYSFIGLTNNRIPEKNRKIKQEILCNFIGSIVELIYRTAEREEKTRYWWWYFLFDLKKVISNKGIIESGDKELIWFASLKI